jgi:hypothetical protein
LKLLKLLVSGVALSALAMILLVSSLVLAAGPRVILLGASSSDPIVARMRDELGVLGFEVEIVIGNATTADLPAVARARGAAAAARIDASTSAIDLWVDPAREPGTLAEQRIDGPGGSALLALRAVELLRGRLIPSGPAPTIDAAAPADLADTGAPDAAPPTPPEAPTLSAPKVAPPAASSLPTAGPFALFLAPAVLLSPGGLPATPHVRLGAEWFPVDRVGVDFVTFLPTVPATVSAAEGSVALRILELGGGLHGTLTDPASALSFRVGLGLNAMLVVFDGNAAPPFIAARGSSWIASPYASIGAAYRAYPRLAIRAEMLATLVTPEPVLRIAEREVASFGQPAVFLSLGIEVRP